jgi:hypothetical protein
MSEACYCDYEMPSLISHGTHTAKKAHKCYECARSILPGERYESTWGIWSGEANTYKTCSHCIALRDWVKAHVPCFCWAFGHIREDAIETAQGYAHEAPGLLFGAWRREVRIKRARQAQLTAA